MTHHRFVSQMADGTLSSDIFRTYFLQDYVFVNDLVPLAAQGIAKAPNLDTASIFYGFLAGVLDPENDLFITHYRYLGTVFIY